MTYTPTDDLIGPIAAAIGNIISAQITSIDRIYTYIPDGPPETNAVAIPLSHFEILDDTNGKLFCRLTYNIRYVTRRKSSDEATVDCYKMFTSLMKVFASWPNQSLGGLSKSMTVKNGGVTQMIASGQVFMSLITNLQVLTEFNIPTS